MTVVKFTARKGRFEFRAEGHAKDPRVCAAVSMMAGTLASWAMNYGVNPKHKEGSGLVTVSFNVTPDSGIVFRFAELGFLELQHSYGDDVKVISG